MDDRIQVFLIDRSLLSRTLLIQALGSDPSLRVAGMAESDATAGRLLPAARPDVVVLVDGGDARGPEVVRRVRRMGLFAVIAAGDVRQRAALLNAGAVNFQNKPEDAGEAAWHAYTEGLIKKIKEACKRADAVHPPPAAQPGGGGAFDGVVALGASTGGTQSTAEILRALPEDFPGMVIVQHMPKIFTRLYAENLDRECAMSIREARDGDAVECGRVLIAPGEQHMRLVKHVGGGYAVHCAPGPRVNGHCPSVDELFFSVARTAGASAVGVILTGMGMDGALGLCEMRRRGAYTIGQDENTCVVYGMPREAYERGGVVKQAPLYRIPGLLISHAKRGRPR